MAGEWHQEMYQALNQMPPDFYTMIRVVQSSESTVLKVRDSQARRTPLHMAAMYNKVAYAAMLLSRGADIEARDIWLWTPLMSAAFGDANGAGPATAELLIEYGADVNATCIKGTNACHVCASYGSISLMRRLIERGGNLAQVDNIGETPLHKAALRGSLEIVLLLLSHGANPSVRSIFGYTPADLALMQHSDLEPSYEHATIAERLTSLSNSQVH